MCEVWQETCHDLTHNVVNHSVTQTCHPSCIDKSVDVMFQKNKIANWSKRHPYKGWLQPLIQLDPWHTHQEVHVPCSSLCHAFSKMFSAWLSNKRFTVEKLWMKCKREWKQTLKRKTFASLFLSQWLSLQQSSTDSSFALWWGGAHTLSANRRVMPDQHVALRMERPNRPVAHEHPLIFWEG